MDVEVRLGTSQKKKLGAENAVASDKAKKRKRGSKISKVEP